MNFYTTDEVESYIQEAYNMGKEDLVDYINESYKEDYDNSVFNRVMQENTVIKANQKKACIYEIAKDCKEIANDKFKILTHVGGPTSFKDVNEYALPLYSHGSLKNNIGIPDIIKNPKSGRLPTIGAYAFLTPVGGALANAINLDAMIGYIKLIPKEGTTKQDIHETYKKLEKYRDYSSNKYQYSCKVNMRDTIRPAILIEVYASKK